MLSRISTIALHTFKESVREKVLYNLIGFALLLIAAAVLFGSISIGVDKMMLVNLGLSSISVFGLLMSIFIGIGLVSKEIERRTIYNILSKPVARFEFIIGKYLGLLLTLAINTAVMTVGFYAALFYLQRGLTPSDWVALQCIYLILLEFAMVVGVALLFSSVTTPILSATFTFCIYVIGNFLSDIRGFGRESRNALLGKLTAALYYLLPNFHDFQTISKAAHGIAAPRYLVTANSLYALLYVTILVAAAVLIFEAKEFR
jgi:ABC-type transport system involved in multi-copper enzyme maturation permease subunit